MQDELTKGWALHQAGDRKHAEEVYRSVLARQPENANAWCYLGMACHDQRRFAEAVAAYQRALQIQPRFPIVYNNLGNTLRLQSRIDAALRCFDHALELKPDYANAFKNKGVTLLWEGHLDQAAMCFREALKRASSDAETQKNLAIIQLLRGEFQTGWEAYESRLKAVSELVPDYSQPRWTGDSLDGRSILLVCEQGLGDVIHFIRYAAHLKQSFDCQVLVACPRSLLPLMHSVSGIDALCEKDAVSAEFDVWSPLLSLPHLLKHHSEDMFPAEIPYVGTDASLEDQWRQRVQHSGITIGIAWRGGREFAADQYRSVTLQTLAPLGRLDGVTLLSLQKDATKDEIDACRPYLDVKTLDDDWDTVAGPFMDTAAIMKQLDLVITVDTVIGHLAGALGVPVWIALSHIPDWRWQLDRDDSAWYPTARLFRQPKVRDWNSVFMQMANAISREFPSVTYKSPSAYRLATSKHNRLIRGRHGLLLYNRHDIYVGRSIDQYGEYSEGEVELFRQMLRPGSTVVEAGANIGAHTLVLGELVGSDGHVIAFEPQRHLFQTLCANVALNGLTNVECRCEAVGDREDWVRIPVLDPDRECNFAGLGITEQSQGERRRMVTLDGLSLPRCDFLKADVEGMELSVLKGAIETIERFHPLLYVENDRQDRSPALIEYLLQLGYRLYWHLPRLFNPNNYFVNSENIFGNIVSANMLCVHSSIPSNIMGLTEITDPSSHWGTPK